MRRSLAAMVAAPVLTVMLAGGFTPGVAVAQPPEPETRTAVLNLRALGVDPTVALYGVEGTQTLTIPVPPGLAPEALTATAILPVNVRGAVLEVLEDDRTLSRVRLPGPGEAPVSLPLVGAEVVDNAITVQVRSYLELPEGYCNYNPEHPLRLVDAAVRYTGAETPPTSVADFMPPVLEKLTIFVPGDPTRVESEAAVRIATTTVARYGPQLPAIEIAELGPGPLAAPRALERQIVIEESDEPGVRLYGTNVVRALAITGSNAELLNQSRLLSSSISALAVTSAVVVSPLPATEPTVIGDEITLRELGQPGLNATALVHPQVTVLLDQTRIGRPVQGARVHLIGTYTPLPSALGGMVVVRVGDQAIASWPTDNTGRIDRWVDIPNRMLGRYTNLDVAVDAAGNTGLCGEFQPITLTIDGSTVIQTQPADPPVPTGFQSLPQALMPRIEVGMDQGFDNTRRAVQILVGQQRLSGQALDAVLVTVDDALWSGDPAIVISPESWPDDAATLPVDISTEGQVDVQNVDGTGQSATLRLSPGIEAGSLQTVEKPHRTVLAATSNGTPAELDRLLAWLDADIRRWQRLTGVAVLAIRDRPPVTVPLTATPPSNEVEPGGDTTAIWGIAAGSVAVLVLGLAWVSLQRRRSRAQP